MDPRSVQARRVGSNKIEQKTDRTRIERFVFDRVGRSNRIEHLILCEFDFRTDRRNRTKTNKIEHSRTETGSILFGIHLLTPETKYDTQNFNHNQPLLTGIERKHSKKYQGYAYFVEAMREQNERIKRENKTTVQFMQFTAC